MEVEQFLFLTIALSAIVGLVLFIALTLSRIHKILNERLGND